MKLIRSTVLAGVLAVTCLGGLSAPAHATPCQIGGGPFSGKNCLWVVLCTQDFAGHQDPGTYVDCLD